MEQFSFILLVSRDMKLELFCLTLLFLPLLGDEIKGGDKVSSAKYPFIARLQIGAHSCTGSLVTKNLILTAKHCFYTKSGKLYSRHGTATFHDYSKKIKEKGQFKVNMELFKDDFDDSDLALAKLSQDIEDITPVRVSQARINPGKTYTGVGYGMHGFKQSDGHLRDIKLEILSVRGNWIKTKLGKSNEGPCAGDSGGPLLARDSYGWFVVAALNGHGYDCRENKLSDKHPDGDIWSSVRVIEDDIEDYVDEDIYGDDDDDYFDDDDFFYYDDFYSE